MKAWEGGTHAAKGVWGGGIHFYQENLKSASICMSHGLNSLLHTRACFSPLLAKLDVFEMWQRKTFRGLSLLEAC